MKHSKRHTPDSFSKKINIDQLRTMMIICHRNILVWPQIFESACDANTTRQWRMVYRTRTRPNTNTHLKCSPRLRTHDFALRGYSAAFKLEQLRTSFAFKNMTRNTYLVPEIQFAYSWTWTCFIYYWMITLLRRSDALVFKDSLSHRVYT